jgi:Kef-type K+ transport system membrane component KefB
VIEIGPHDAVLEAVATLTLSLVLFLDAVKLDVKELGRKWAIPFLILGPGTLLIIAIGAVPFVLVFGFSWIVALMGGAILASTDPVVLREILRDNRIPRSARQVLRIEAGTNDIGLARVAGADRRPSRGSGFIGSVVGIPGEASGSGARDWVRYRRRGGVADGSRRSTHGRAD